MIEMLLAKSFEGLSVIQTIAKSELGRLAEHVDIKDINKKIYDSPLENDIQTLVEYKYKESLVDSNGDIYSIDGDLLPNNTYKLNDVLYSTDEYGRIIHAETSKLYISSDNIRDSSAQLHVGGIDRRPNDHGGHIISRESGGDSGIGNLVAMDSRINQSDYRQMENFITSLNEKNNFKLQSSDIKYTDLSHRPDILYTDIQCMNNELYKYTFNNNMDQSFRELVSDNAKDMVNARLEDKQEGVISSIREHYDSTGTLIDEKYTITYSDDGIIKRTVVNVNNNI